MVIRGSRIVNESPSLDLLWTKEVYDEEMRGSSYLSPTKKGEASWTRIEVYRKRSITSKGRKSRPLNGQEDTANRREKNEEEITIAGIKPQSLTRTDSRLTLST